ncbi:uncharacterized protein TNCV_4175061 [Trichonephila clavipes]|nr:uncharacterized protein TNCV_4175061 [Trichonephila clavipes]
MSLRVPENYTAFEVMELAQSVDPKYKFDWKRISEKKYVYQIAGIVNDPEIGKFWLLYLSPTTKRESLVHLTTSPDELIIKNENHIIMWYKTASI